MQQRLIFYVIASSTIFSKYAGELLMKPRSTESKVGETTYFNCSTSLEDRAIFWFHGSNYVYTTLGILDPYRERFKVDWNASEASYNLVLRSVKPGDAGEYICVDDDGLGTRQSAELIVLDNDPECQSNIQPDGVIGQNIFDLPPDEVQLTCTVTYHGNIPPKLEWKKVGDMNRSITDSVSSNVTSNNRLVYTLKLKGDISLDKSSYVCQTRRSTKNQYKCNSEIIKVLYFIGNNVTEQNVVRGDEITCIANNRSFACINQWYHSDNSCPLSCDETITTHLLGEYLCTVKCHVRGRDYYFEALKAVVLESPPSLTSGQIAAAVVIPIIVIIMLVASIAVLAVRYKRRKFLKKILRRISLLETEEERIESLYVINYVYNGGERERTNVAETEIELLHKIRREAIDEEAILGVTILGGKMFLVHENSSVLEVYDCYSSNFSRSRNLLKVNELLAAVDICSCKKNNCLYIMDKKNGNTPKEVVKISTQGNLISKWPTKHGAQGHLSVTAEGNVIVTVQNKHLLLEYSPVGKLVREIKLPGCINPWHAIKMDNDRYIVSHGILFDRFHRVCLVNKDGVIQKSFGSEIGSAKHQLNMPVYLAVGSSGCVFVADLCNSRVLLIDSNLDFKTKIVPKYKQRIWIPRRIYLDEGLLVVVISLGSFEKTSPEEEGDFKDQRQKGVSSTEDIELLRKAEEGKAKEVDVSQRIEKNCRVLVFDIESLLKKYDG